MLHACLYDWQNKPEVSTMVLRVGDLQLSIVSDGETEVWWRILQRAGLYRQVEEWSVRIGLCMLLMIWGTVCNLLPRIVGQACGLSHGPL